jgi:hypothetical protein
MLWFGLAKWILPSTFAEYSNKVLAREECNKYDLTAGPCHWPIVMIGPGGLLLVVSHLFGVLVLVLWMPISTHTCKQPFSLNLAPG